jgi:hypothetical protein
VDGDAAALLLVLAELAGHDDARRVRAVLVVHERLVRVLHLDHSCSVIVMSTIGCPGRRRGW